MTVLRVLMVEDSGTDAWLVLRYLRGAGYEVTHTRVETSEAFRLALDATWDVVIADYTLPRFGALEALDLLRKSGHDLPFLIVSGSIGEDTAVEAMRAGAQDYILKDNLTRLAPAIERERREARARAEGRVSAQQLLESQARFRTAADTAPVLMWSADGDGRCTFVNQPWLDFTGRPLAQELGDGWTARIHPEDLPRYRETYAAAVRASRPFSLEYRLRRVDGEHRSLLNTGTPLIGADGKFGGYIGSCVDITEGKRLAAQMLSTDRLVAVGTLVVGVAHEINNPLAYLLFNLDFAAREVAEVARLLATTGGVAGAAARPDDAPALAPLARRLDEVTRALGEAREGAERVRNIVRDLKTFSRADDEAHGPVDLRAVIDLAVNMASSEIRQRARMVREFADVPAVEGNASRLGQVFLNLLINAAQALPEGQADRHEVRVVTRLDGAGRVVAEVRDTGAGIPPAVLGQIFDPFFTTKPVGVGTGLGLSICHGIVTSLGGEITIESVVGRGTTVRVALRVAHPGVAPRAPLAKSVPAPGRRRGRVLLIDDDVMVLAALRRTLAPEHDVVVETRGLAALARVEAGERFDAIVCDLMMPEMTGMDLHRALARVADDLATRIIFLSGGAFTAGAREFLDHVANPRLEKPCDLAALRALIRDLVR